MSTSTDAPAAAAGGARAEITVDSPLWDSTPSAETVVRAAIAAAGESMEAAEVSVVLTDDAAVRALNHRWRGINSATNVLSFPAARPAGEDESPNSAPSLLGDVVVAYETTAREAEAEGKPLLDHLSHLVVHGFLHLLGYDHESDAAAEEMEHLERTILARLGLPDPYDVRDAAD